MLTNNPDTSIRSHAKWAIEMQIDSLRSISDGLDQSFDMAVEMVCSSQKAITTGLGKSAFIAKKLAATLNSVRIPSVFVHPVDALHGDSGLVNEGDVVIAFSKSGETAEVHRFLDVMQPLGVKVIAVVSRQDSSIATMADVALTVPVKHEMDALNILPTTSTTSALVMADLLAVCASMKKGSVEQRLARTHPAGSIGAKLLTTVDQCMISGDALPVIESNSSMDDAVHKLTEYGLGIVCICEDTMLLGIITDGDVRRWLENRSNSTTYAACDVMIKQPVVIGPTISVHEALQIMERRERPLNVLPVVVDGQLVGILRLHEVVKMQL